MRQIDSELFVRLMQMGGEDDELWFTDDCVVSEEGVKSTLPNSSLSTDADNRQTRSLLNKADRIVIDEIAEGFELALPCNYMEFRGWVVRNDFDDVLGEADALFYRKYADVEDKHLYLLVGERKEEGFQAAVGSREAEEIKSLLGEVDFESLMDSPISETVERKRLNELDEFERSFHLYVWLGLLNEALRKGGGAEVKNKFQVGRRQLVKKRLAEVQILLNGKCLGDSESMLEAEPDLGKESVAKNELAHTTWLREKWVEMGKPKGNGFFSGLKAFKGKEDSPVSDWYTVSRDGAGIKLVYSDGNICHVGKKQVQKWASKFAKE